MKRFYQILAYHHLVFGGESTVDSSGKAMLKMA